jgi:dTDP-4-amino-4,6-dideoxygalactose transaminase
MYERYHHDVVGVNSRLDSMQATVLRAKLPHLDTYNEKRRNASRRYTELLAHEARIITPIVCSTCDCHVFHQYTLILKDTDRDGLVRHLQSKGIPCGVYYPIPLHLQKAYKDQRYREENFTVTNSLVKECISLPMHTELDEEQIRFITDSVLEFVQKDD